MGFAVAGFAPEEQHVYSLDTPANIALLRSAMFVVNVML